MRARAAAGFLSTALLAVCTFGLPAAALAQGPSSPFSPGLPQPTGSAPTTTQAPFITPTTTSTSTGGTFSGSSAIAIALGAMILIGGIGFFIWRDARRRAPVRHAHATAVSGRTGTKKPVKPRKLSPAERRRRKRGKAR